MGMPGEYHPPLVVFTSVVTKEVTVVRGFATLTPTSQVQCKKRPKSGAPRGSSAGALSAGISQLGRWSCLRGWTGEFPHTLIPHTLTPNVPRVQDS